MNETEIDSAHEGEDLLSVAPDGIEVRRHAGVAAGVGLTASAVAIAYLGRATQSGSALDWAFVVVMGLLGAYWLASLVDARTPLLVADAQGIRIRLGRTWRGLPWTAVHHVEHTPRRGPLRDGRLVVVPHNLELIESELTGAGKRHTTISRMLHGAPLAVPLGLSTRVVGAGDDLTLALGRVARDASQVVLVEPDDAHRGRRGRRCRHVRRPRSRTRSSPARRRPPCARPARPVARRSVATSSRRRAGRDRRARGPRAPPSRSGQPGRGDPVVGRPRPRHRPCRRARRAARARRLRGRARRGPGHRSRARRGPHPARPHRRPARRAHPDPSARHRGRRGRRLRAVRWRLLRPRPPAHARPGARRRRGAAAGVVRRALRPRPDQPAPGLRGRAGHRLRTARSAAPAAAPTGRCSSRS